MWRGRRRRGRVWGGVPLPHQGVFAFLRFKISNLVHTFGEFDDVQPLRKGLEVKGVGGGIPLPHQVVFASLELKKKRFGAYFG